MIKAHNLYRRFEEVKQDYFDSLAIISKNEKTNNGYFTTEVEKYLQQLSNKKHALLLRSGSQALYLSLLVNNIGAGDEVVITGYSCMASLTYILNIGATPVFCDVNRYGLMEIDESLITKNTKAIVGTGLYGDSYDFDHVDMLCEKYNLIHINDASQSYLGKYNTEECSSLGDLVCLSFAENKPIPSLGTHGAILLDDTEKYLNLINFRKHGKPYRRSDWVSSGINGVPEEDKAAQILAATKHVDRWQKRRIDIANYYDDEFTKSGVRIRHSPKYSIWNAHKYVIFVPDKFNYYKKFKSKGIETECHYPDVFSHLSFIKYKNLPNCKFFAKHALTLPLNPHLSNEEVERVIITTNQILIK